MIMEITDKGFHLENNVWSNANKLTNKTPNINIMNPNKGWSSGPTAMLLASQHKHDLIYILGFDYVGLGEKHERVNNMYAGTKNYKSEHDRATYYGNWTRQTMMCANQFPRTKYVRIIGRQDSFIPDHLKDLQNFSHITLEDFRRNFKIKPVTL
jgi:hypothetical protein